jgi:hypothetical protein
MRYSLLAMVARLSGTSLYLSFLYKKSPGLSIVKGWFLRARAVDTD